MKRTLVLSDLKEKAFKWPKMATLQKIFKFWPFGPCFDQGTWPNLYGAHFFDIFRQCWWRNLKNWVSLKGQILLLLEQPCWLYTLIAQQRHSPLPGRSYPTENWLSSRCLTSVIVWELVLPSWHEPMTVTYTCGINKLHLCLSLTLLVGCKCWHLHPNARHPTSGGRKAGLQEDLAIWHLDKVISGHR